jgi:hypothetical protein
MTNLDNPVWPRNYFAASPRQAELFYLVIGPPPPQSLQISAKRHHLSRVEPEVVVSMHRKEDAPDWFQGWFADPLGAELEGLFLTPDEVRAATHLTTVRGTFADPPDLNYLRNTIGLVSAIADTPGTLAIFDASAISWWRPSDWRAAFVDKAEFFIDDHIRIIMTDDEQQHPGLWSHTRGMIKFARPDVQMKHIPGPYSSTSPIIRAAGRVIRDIADYLARGAILRDGRVLNDHRTKQPIIFRESADDSETKKHFNNSVLEICDYDEQKEVALEGATRLLEKSARESEHD